MGLLDNNSVITTPKTGLEGTSFKKYISNDSYDLFIWNDGVKYLRLSYRDIYAWVNLTTLFLVKGKITDTPIEIEINDTNFPNLRKINNSWPTIERVIACPCSFATPSNSYGHQTSLGGESCRVCVIFTNGQIYHNYPSCHNGYDFSTQTIAKTGVTVASMFDKFDESVVWDLPNRKHPVQTNVGDDAGLIATGVYYYNPALQSKHYEFHPALNQSNGYGNTEGFGATTTINNASNGLNIGIRPRFFRIDMDNPNANSFAYMGGYVNDERYTMIGTYRTNGGNNPCRICVFGTQDGGRSWFNMFEFGADVTTINSNHETLAYANSGTTGIPLVQGSDTASSGIYSLRRRYSIVPDATTKEPSDAFYYGPEINITSIVSDSTNGKIIVTTENSIESSSILANGDCIVIGYQSGVGAANRPFDWIVNSSANISSGGNGIMFIVREKTENTFVLTLFLWNPDSELPVRHIHALNKCKDGVAVSSGEDYSKGGWILYNSIISADAFGNYNIASISQNKFLRLNSTKTSFARPLGVVIQQEEDNTYAYIGMDTAIVDMGDVEMPSGRTKTFKHNSCGLWKSPISGFDDMANNAVLKYPSSETCFGFQKFGNAMVFIGQYGDFALSYDDGKTWSTCKIPVGHRGQNGCHYSGMTYDNKFSVDNILVQLKR